MPLPDFDTLEQVGQLPDFETLTPVQDLPAGADRPEELVAGKPFVPPSPIAVEAKPERAADFQTDVEGVGDMLAKIPGPMLAANRAEAEAWKKDPTLRAATLRAHPERGTLWNFVKDIYETEESARKESVGGEYPKFDVSKSTTVPGAMLKSAANVAMSLPEFAETPLGGAAIPASIAAPIPTALAFAGLGAKGTSDLATQLGSQWDTMGTPQKAAALGIDLPAQVAMTVLPAHAAVRGGMLPQGRAATLEVIAEAKKRAAKKGATDASKVSEATEVHGDVQPQPAPPGEVSTEEGGARVQPQAAEVGEGGQQGLLLTEEDHAALERAAIDAGKESGSDVKIVDKFTGESENNPFHRRIAMPVEGGMEIRRSSLREELASMPPENRAAYMKALVTHEHVHRHVSPEMAKDYWGTLTKLEQAAETHQYTGDHWSLESLNKELAKRGSAPMTETQLGHEALRRRWEILEGKTPAETLAAVKKEKWSVRSVYALADMVRNVREIMGTKASQDALNILSKLQKNLDTATFALTGQTPAHLSREGLAKDPRQPTADELIDMDPSKMGAWVKEIKYHPDDAARWASQMTEQDIARVDAEQKRVKAEYSGLLDEVKKNGYTDASMSKILALGLKSQTLREVVEDFGKPVKREAPASISKGKAQGGGDYDEHIGDYIRGLEEVAAHFKASGQTKEAARFQEEADEMKRRNPNWQQKSFPASISRKRADDKTGELALGKVVPQNVPQPEKVPQQTPLQPVPKTPAPEGAANLPPVSPGQPARLPQGPDLRPPQLPLRDVQGESVSREAFQPPQAKAIDETASRIVTESLARGEIPDFEKYHGELQGKYGAGLTKEKAFYPWNDAVQNQLVTAKGTVIRGLLGKLGLVDDVAQALKPMEKDPYLGTIPDAPPDVMAQGKLPEIEQAFQPNKWKTPAKTKAKFAPEQQRRLAAIGAIFDKLAEKAGGRPKTSLFRKQVGPEDIQSRFIVISPAEPIPGAEGEFSQPEIETGRQFRAFTPDQAADPKLVGEAVTSAAREKGQKVSATKGLLALKDKINGRVILVSAWKDGRRGPVVTNPEGAGPSVKIDPKLLDRYEPTHALTLREPVEDFRQVFSDPANFAGWFGDVGVEGTRGIRTSSFQGPEAGVAREQAGITGASRRGALPEEPLRALAGPETPSKTLRELAMPRFARKGVPAEPRVPGTMPETPGALLPPEIASQVAEKAKALHPYEPTSFEGQSPELEKRGISIMPGARGERPASISKAKAAAKEQWDVTKGDIKASVTKRRVKQEIPGMLDGAENAGRQFAGSAKQAIVLASGEKLPGGMTRSLNPLSPAGKAFRSNKAEATQRRRAGIAYIAAGQTDATGHWYPNKGKLVSFETKLDIAEAKAMAWARDINPLKRREGARWLKTVKQMQEDLQYAQDHWKDPAFIDGAKQYQKEIHDTIEFENFHGSSTVERDNYIPGLWEGAFWSDNGIAFPSRRLLGSAFRLPKKFNTPYDAIANGPYYLRSTDLADLAEHRINAGHRQVERKMWLNALQGVKLDGIDKLAKEPKLTMVKEVNEEGETTQRPLWTSPDPGYVLVYPSPGAKPIAVKYGYQGLVETLISPSKIEHIPFGKDALALTGVLKHGVILLWDTFHPGRLTQYAEALMSGKMGSEGGYSSLSYRPEDLGKAVDQGYISPRAAEWTSTPVDVNTGRGRTVRMTRKNIADDLIRSGLNASKASDALYRHAIQEMPLVGEGVHKLISPYNNLLFGRVLPGMMIEAAVRNFEAINKSHPDTPLSRVRRDVVKDINGFFGNMGRQGIFKSATFRDMAQLTFLAPMWQEGLLRKEMTFATRTAMAPIRGIAALAGKELPYRKGLPAFGTTGKAMATGLGTYMVLTQLINLVTRKQFTWQNKEEGHKWDAFIPIGDRGFWLSPMAVFAEVTHDFMRLGETKPTVMDRITKMGENRLGPVGKAAAILYHGETPTGEKYTTSAGRIGGALAQVTPGAGAVPITVAAPARALGHAIAPKYVSPNPPGAFARQAAASITGVKLTPAQSQIARVQGMARKFMEKNDYAKETGWREVMADEPSYTRLRQQLRAGDEGAAERTWKDLHKGGRTDNDIIKAMKLWAKKNFTGKREKEFVNSLSDPELETYTKANEERQELLDSFFLFANRQP